MEKQKKWHAYIILIVLALTVYNILPTVFFYSKPLKKPIDSKEALAIGEQSLSRVNALETFSRNWIQSFSNLLNVKTQKITLDTDNPQFIHVTFKNSADAAKFARIFPRAGALIPFNPAQLSLRSSNALIDNEVVIQRRIPIHFTPKKESSFFAFAEKPTDESEIDPVYKEVVGDRLKTLAYALAGPSENAALAQAITTTPQHFQTEESILILADRINTYEKTFRDSPRILDRYFASLNRDYTPLDVNALINEFQKLVDTIRLHKGPLIEKESNLKNADDSLPSEEAEQLAFLKQREDRVGNALSLLKKKRATVEKGSAAWAYPTVVQKIAKLSYPEGSLSVAKANPLIDTMRVNLARGTVTLSLQKDIQQHLSSLSDQGDQGAEQLTQLIYNEIARLSRETGETLLPQTDAFTAQLSELADSKSMLVFKLEKIAEEKAQQIASLLRNEWRPTAPEFQSDAYPIVSEQQYQALSAEKKRFALVITAPVANLKHPVPGMNPGSLYVVAKGADRILKKIEQNRDADASKEITRDFKKLQEILRNNGFIGYMGSKLPAASGHTKDFIFEEEEYFSSILKATRENFAIHGSKKYAVLEFTNQEQRLLTQNKIETEIHEELLKWRDDYNAAQISPDPEKRLEVPKPTQNPLWSNFVLSFKKYFRGDERKILRWGLDLSGGKAVQIQLRDQNNRIVKNEADIKQGIGELFRRVNKMGVSEVAIRQEGTNIAMEFPGSQNLSASDLVKASSMQFHIVNETFSTGNKNLREVVAQFLQDIWNEAVVTGQKDIESINRIAWNHLYGRPQESTYAKPRSEAAKILYQNGLRLANPDATIRSSDFDDSLSMIAAYRGDSFAEWEGQTNPLLIVFNNYVLEGAHLDNIRASYDPNKGNFLSFEIQGSQTLPDGQKINPRSDVRTWTQPFSKDGIMDSPRAEVSNGRGWRMAVVLNGSIISAPTLNDTISSSASISGSFTAREIKKLEADLKAGSLTFAPYILSEQNISPDLGIKDRVQGIVATCLALVAVIAVMIGYYRFAGVIASAAVLCNLLIMWAALQNIGATITLAGIAGIILTVGMAVDANVLVFERIREEFQRTQRLASAVKAGYAKAFSAILDSNVTTIIAALILLNFDSGPIKGFAVTLIIGIASSMFTALFMTRYFFVQWVQRTKHTTLSMAQWFTSPRINFLRYAKPFIALSLLVAAFGGYVAASGKASLLGMDFTGGFSIQVEIEPKQDADYRTMISNALEKAGLAKQDFEIKQLTPKNNVKILLSSALEQKGKPFYNMPLEVQGQTGIYTYETNPRLEWIVSTLGDSGVALTSPSLTDLHQNWTKISGQMSSAMRNNAIIGLGLAFACILLYIGFRFEFKYALASTLGLAFDVSVTIGVISLLSALGVPVQIDLKTIAALMTIIGYSLNDTIIIFDRIREDLRLFKKRSVKDVMQQALNITLSRTIMTSFTTLVVLLALIILGGATIFGLALVMIIGVCYGTLSSLFVATPLLYALHKNQARRDAVTKFEAK